MSETNYHFDLYRLNVVDDEGQLFDWVSNPVRGDNTILHLLQAATAPELDHTVVTDKITVKWSIRQYSLYAESSDRTGSVAGVTLARSTLSETGPTVKDDGIEETKSDSFPAIAKTVLMTFYMGRHIVAVEHNSVIVGTQAWRQAFHKIVSDAANRLKLTSTIELEPIPGDNEIIQAFKSYSKLVTLKVHLRIPNPEIDRITKRLMDDMRDGGVRDYVHRMHNPNGLNQSEAAIPFAVATLAQAGYKKGEVLMDGVVDGQRKRKKTGSRAAKSGIATTRDYVRGALSAVKTQEAKKVLQDIIGEIDRTNPPPKVDEAGSAASRRKKGGHK